MFEIGVSASSFSLVDDSVLTYGQASKLAVYVLFDVFDESKSMVRSFSPKPNAPLTRAAFSTRQEYDAYRDQLNRDRLQRFLVQRSKMTY